MKPLITFIFLSAANFIFVTSSTAEGSELKNDLNIISIYQIEDDVKSGFDFFTSQKTHKCGGKLSNRHRSYSDHKEVALRKFELVLAALNHQHKVSIKSLGCEGRAMLVDYIGISLSP